MRISDEALTEFIVICEEEHGVRLERGEALVIAKRLLMLYDLMHRPLPADLISTPPSGLAADPQTDPVPGAS